MNESESVVLAGKLFASRGRIAAAEIVAEYAEAIMDAGCGSCIRDTVDDFRRNATSSRAPTVPELWAAYHHRNGSPAHTPHIGTDETQVRVGATEGFFRGSGALIAKDVYPDLTREQSVYVSLSAWWADCPATSGHLRVFLEDSGGWVHSTVDYFNHRPDRVIQLNKLASACRKRDSSPEGIEALDFAELP